MGKRHRRFCIAVAAVVIAACTTEAQRPNDDGDPSSGSTSSGAGAAGGASSSASTAAAGGGGAAPSIAICLPACATPADCDAGTPALDADNFTCEGGACRYRGCNDDTECQAQGDYVCRELADPQGLGAARSCVATCSTALDCSTASAPFDADNYACVQGGCQYQGCNDEAECQTLGDYHCRDTGAGVAFCTPACATPSDCDLGAGPAYDANNYTCDNGTCVYLGCQADECASLGNYLCVE